MSVKENILIIAAMEDVELDYLRNKISNLKKVKYNGFIFYEGEMFEKNIILCVSGIGIINASILTTIAIEKYNPKFIINEGVAGGYTTNTPKGKIVVRNRCDKYNFNGI